jgi:hypothetical protein
VTKLSGKYRRLLFCGGADRLWLASPDHGVSSPLALMRSDGEGSYQRNESRSFLRCSSARSFCRFWLFCRLGAAWERRPGLSVLKRIKAGRCGFAFRTSWIGCPVPANRESPRMQPRFHGIRPFALGKSTSLWSNLISDRDRYPDTRSACDNIRHPRGVGVPRHEVDYFPGASQNRDQFGAPRNRNP